MGCESVVGGRSGHNGRRARHPDVARVRMSMLKIARWIVAAAAVGALVYTHRADDSELERGRRGAGS